MLRDENQRKPKWYVSVEMNWLIVAAPENKNHALKHVFAIMRK